MTGKSLSVAKKRKLSLLLISVSYALRTYYLMHYVLCIYEFFFLPGEGSVQDNQVGVAREPFLLYLVHIIQ